MAEEADIPADLRGAWEIAKAKGKTLDEFFKICELLAEIVDTADSNSDGAFGVMRDMEVSLGSVVVNVGAVKPFAVSTEDWEPKTLITVRGLQGRLIAIQAKQPGNGALKRLVANIKAARMIPVIVCPVGYVMSAILAKWKWRCVKIGEAGDNLHEEWSP